jgi:putative ABC transport system permease protein
MYKNYLRVRLPDGTLVQSRVVGIDDATLVGGPPEYAGDAELADLRDDRAVFISEHHAARELRIRRGPDAGRALRVGDRISVNDHDAVVAGVYRASQEFFWEPVLYTTYSRALAWAPRERKLLTYVLVKVADGVDPHAVAARITAATGLKALTNAEFDGVTTHEMLTRTGILINFGITIALGFVIGLLVAGQTFYTFVLDNLRHFAALMAMGAGRGTVLRMLTLQVVVVGLIGYGLGLGAASLSGALLGGSGGLAFQMSWHIPVLGAVGVLCCCLAAGTLGMLRVLRTEPAMVFKG